MGRRRCLAAGQLACRRLPREATAGRPPITARRLHQTRRRRPMPFRQRRLGPRRRQPFPRRFQLRRPSQPRPLYQRLPRHPRSARNQTRCSPRPIKASSFSLLRRLRLLRPPRRQPRRRLRTGCVGADNNIAILAGTFRLTVVRDFRATDPHSELATQSLAARSPFANEPASRTSCVAHLSRGMIAGPVPGTIRRLRR